MARLAAAVVEDDMRALYACVGGFVCIMSVCPNALSFFSVAAAGDSAKSGEKSIKACLLRALALLFLFPWPVLLAQICPFALTENSIFSPAKFIGGTGTFCSALCHSNNLLPGGERIPLASVFAHLKQAAHAPCIALWAL
jgi:hypothetical protein